MRSFAEVLSEAESRGVNLAAACTAESQARLLRAFEDCNTTALRVDACVVAMPPKAPGVVPGSYDALGYSGLARGHGVHA
jgi:hypothetical protein